MLLRHERERQACCVVSGSGKQAALWAVAAPPMDPTVPCVPLVPASVRSSEADRAPAALLAAPPGKLLISLEQMQRAFWEQTAYGRGILHQLEHAPFETSPQSRRALQTAPYGNRCALTGSACHSVEAAVPAGPFSENTPASSQLMF